MTSPFTFTLNFEERNNNPIRPPSEDMTIYGYQGGYDISRYTPPSTLSGWSGSSLGDITSSFTYSSYFYLGNLYMVSNPAFQGSQGKDYYISIGDYTTGTIINDYAGVIIGNISGSTLEQFLVRFL